MNGLDTSWEFSFDDEPKPKVEWETKEEAIARSRARKPGRKSTQISARFAISKQQFVEKARTSLKKKTFNPVSSSTRMTRIQSRKKRFNRMLSRSRTPRRGSKI
ncbi:hypothetical protein L218DRAFT_376658 [Marasmius fiardii PR-910]|nr:hypothetical protein L218DRAFT_376658 [Marasmius fiardii PR-910]